LRQIEVHEIWPKLGARENLTCSVPVTVKHQAAAAAGFACPCRLPCRNKLGQQRRHTVRFDPTVRTVDPAHHTARPPLLFHHTTARRNRTEQNPTRAATDELTGSVDVWRRSGGRLLARVRRQDVLSSLLKHFFYGGIVGATHQRLFFLQCVSQLDRFLSVELIYLSLNFRFNIDVIFMVNYFFSGM
jgi:hypothetical protein